MTVNDMSVVKMTETRMSVSKMTVNKKYVDEMIVNKTSIVKTTKQNVCIQKKKQKGQQMLVNEMTINKRPCIRLVHKMSVAKRTVNKCLYLSNKTQNDIRCL